MRNRIKNLIKDIHHKAARYLLANHHTILLPKFNAHLMCAKENGKISKATVRTMLKWSHGIVEVS